MKLLLIDTSWSVLLVGVEIDGNRSVFCSDLGMKSTSRSILPTTNEALNELGISPLDIDYFGGVVGPGSFTGIRIGTSFVNGLAASRGKVLVELSSFERMTKKDSQEKLYLIDAMHDSYYYTRSIGYKSIESGVIEGDKLDKSECEKVFFREDKTLIKEYIDNLFDAMHYKIEKCEMVEFLKPSYLRLSQAERNRSNA